MDVATRGTARPFRCVPALASIFRLKGHHETSLAELGSLLSMVSSHRQFMLDGGRIVADSGPWQASCSSFLENLEAVACDLHVDQAPRHYRQAFSVNYKALFPHNQRHYRADIFKASVEQRPTMWVNGDMFEFGAEVFVLAAALQTEWGKLEEAMERCQSQGVAASGLTRSDLAQVLASVDASWASFEQGYILALMKVEDRARSWLSLAISAEKELATFEAQNKRLLGAPQHCELQQQFVKSLAKLNSVANRSGKGRDDLDGEVLVRADAVLRRDTPNSFAAETARALATEVVEAYEAMRRYLRNVCTLMDHVDPHLCKNAGLVTRLNDVEESWELGTLYVQRSATLGTLCDWVSQLKTAQALSAPFAIMCDNCDVEMFLVMPRLVWLCFLRDPAAQMELMSSLMPKRLSCADDELRALCQQFQQVLVACSWEVIVLKAIAGSSSNNSSELDDFMRDLEHWSMELQRGSPQDWNRCSSVITQCLVGVPKQRGTACDV